MPEKALPGPGREGRTKGGRLLPFQSLVAAEERPGLTPHPAAADGLTGEAVREAKRGCAGGQGGHPWVPRPPLWDVLQSRPKQECQECEMPARCPMQSPHHTFPPLLPGCPPLLPPVARTGYSL